MDGLNSRPGRGLGGELGPTLRLALPVILAELGWVGMGVADIVMVGRLGPAAIGAVGIGNVLFFTVAISGMGMMLGLDTLVSQAFGAGRVEDCHRSLVHGIDLALVLTLPLMLVVALVNWALPSWGVDPAVLRAAMPYLRTLNWGMLPLLLYAALRRYLQGMALVRPLMVALVISNLVNIAGNWVLVYGRLGMPALGVVGSGWATFLARWAVVAILAGAVIDHDRRYETGLWRTPLRLEAQRVRRLLALGVPAALQITMEVGVFAVAATLAGRLGPLALAAHEVVLHAASVTFMVPLGISAAAAVRVGHALGRGDARAAGRAGWAALGIGAGFMTCAGVAFLILPGPILGLFTADRSVLAIGSGLLAVAAMFQLFDGLQVVATGALRGLGDTRTPMLANLAAHWGLGLPIGYALAFPGGRGVLGLWLGLSTGLIAAGIILLGAWALRARPGRAALAAEASCA